VDANALTRRIEELTKRLNDLDQQIDAAGSVAPKHWFDERDLILTEISQARSKWEDLSKEKATQDSRGFRMRSGLIVGLFGLVLFLLGGWYLVYVHVLGTSEKTIVGSDVECVVRYPSTIVSNKPFDVLCMLNRNKGTGTKYIVNMSRPSSEFSADAWTKEVDLVRPSSVDISFKLTYVPDARGWAVIRRFLRRLDIVVALWDEHGKSIGSVQISLRVNTFANWLGALLAVVVGGILSVLKSGFLSWLRRHVASLGVWSET
jgi:hypothetical protein